MWRAVLESSAQGCAACKGGDDALGRCVIDTAGECGVDTSYIQTDRRRVTTVTVVMPRSEDMTRYAIYRKESADGS
ncbi:hypothetical protein LAJLEIBI_03031 [[Clostridium] hylemonae DSM 15053]|nr:hypothetical protein LAJLEIBI_03031 [[Clostridium] hylemonae DSM 15053]